MPDAPANEAGVLFIFEGGSQEVRFWHLAACNGDQSMSAIGSKADITLTLDANKWRPESK
jgi:hypothetical protein